MSGYSIDSEWASNLVTLPERSVHLHRESQSACNEMKTEARDTWKKLLSEGVVR